MKKDVTFLVGYTSVKQKKIYGICYSMVLEIHVTSCMPMADSVADMISVSTRKSLRNDCEL